jgi:hypothetical protein
MTACSTNESGRCMFSKYCAGFGKARISNIGVFRNHIPSAMAPPPSEPALIHDISKHHLSSRKS